jgi:branched-chain amino acid transport system permease protein
MSAHSEAFDEAPTPPLKRLWQAGPYGWNQALTRWYVLIPFFVIAATAPFITQYFVDTFGWTGGEYWLRILTTCAQAASLALALNLVVGWAGLLNLGFIAFFGIGTYVYAMVASEQLHMHLALGPAFAAVVLASIGFALIVGIPSLRLRGDYLAILTLAFGLIVRELVLDLDRPPTLAGHQFGPDDLNLTGGTEGIHQVDPFRLPNSFPVIHGAALQTRTYYWILLGFLAVVVFCLLRWRGTRTGRAWIAIREDELAARAMGVNTFKYRLLAFTASAVIAAIAGMINAARLHNAYPGNYDIQQTVLIFIMVILGGLGSIPGSIIGATFVTVVPFVLQGLLTKIFTPVLVFVAFSLILILTMIFRPEGLLGTVSIRPRQMLGGTVELFAEPEAEPLAAQAPAGESAADLEASTGSIVAPEEGG